jgi:hypothetical protein
MEMETVMNDQYFLEKGFKKRGEDIYVYENFISQEELDLINPILDSIRINKEYDPERAGTTFENRVSRRIDELTFLPQRIRKVFEDKYIVHLFNTVNILSVGHFWLQHFDSHDFLKIRDLAKTLKDGDPYEVIEDTRYGLVAYFNVVEEGGDLVYINQNITYTPKPGDLVVHGAEENCMHEVQTVTKGYRYSYSNNLRVELKIPK